MRWYRRNGIDSSQHAKYHPWLAASLGQVPSAKRGNDTGGRHRDQAAKKPPRCKEPTFPSEPQRGRCHGEHQDGDAVHNAESVKDHAHGRLRVLWSVLQALHSAMKTVREPDAA